MQQRDWKCNIAVHSIVRTRCDARVLVKFSLVAETRSRTALARSHLLHFLKHNQCTHTHDNCCVITTVLFWRHKREDRCATVT
jgi:hypothetical protein